MKKGGILMIVDGILDLIGASPFGILALVLLIVGGILALKENSFPYLSISDILM
jgi:hypothetical protein